MKIPVFDAAGARLREIEAPDDVFGIEPNRSVLHQAYVTQMANRRGGNASTKSRGEVEGSTKKIRKQKGLGASRQGSIRAPHHVGGGVAMGPKPHSFAKDLPRQMRRLALRSALSGHAADGSIRVVTGLPVDGKTKSMKTVMDANGIVRTALLVSGEFDATMTLAARNIEHVKAMPAQYLNVVDVVNAHYIVFTEDAIGKVESLWSGANLKPHRGRKEVASA